MWYSRSNCENQGGPGKEEAEIEWGRDEGRHWAYGCDSPHLAEPAITVELLKWSNVVRWKSQRGKMEFFAHTRPPSLACPPPALKRSLGGLVVC